MTDTLVLLDGGTLVPFSFDDMMRYHGPGSPGGVAHAFKVLERVLPALGPDGPIERREITIRTAFAGPGARDGFELVTRSVTEGRYVVDPSLADPARGPALERFVFCIGVGDVEVTAELQPGFVTEEFVTLVGAEARTDDEERRLTGMKREMARSVMVAPASEVYGLRGPTG